MPFWAFEYCRALPLLFEQGYYCIADARIVYLEGAAGDQETAVLLVFSLLSGTQRIILALFNETIGRVSQR